MLLIRVGNCHFSWAVCDPSGNRLHQLAYYTGAEPVDEHALTQLLQDEAMLRRRWGSCRIALDFPESILVPAAVNASFPAAEALQLQYGQPGPSIIQTEPVAGWQMTNQYRVPASVLEWLQQHFAGARFTQGYTVDLCRVQPTDFEGAISIDFRADEFSVVASRSNKLLLTQTFTYESPADVLYYILGIARQFGFSQQDVRLSVSGLIEKESSLYRDLYQYFIHVRFREAEWQFPPGENSLPSHFFTALYDLAQCG